MSLDQSSPRPPAACTSFLLRPSWPQLPPPAGEHQITEEFHDWCGAAGWEICVGPCLASGAGRVGCEYSGPNWVLGGLDYSWEIIFKQLVQLQAPLYCLLFQKYSYVGFKILILDKAKSRSSFLTDGGYDYWQNVNPGPLTASPPPPPTSPGNL